MAKKCPFKVGDIVRFKDERIRNRGPHTITKISYYAGNIYNKVVYAKDLPGHDPDWFEFDKLAMKKKIFNKEIKKILSK